MSQIRDTFADEAHYVKILSEMRAVEDQRWVEIEQQKAAGTFREREPGIAHWLSWRKRHQILEARYSIGDPIPELAEEFANLVTELPELEALDSRMRGDLFTTLCSWAVLLDDHSSGTVLGAVLERDNGFHGRPRSLLEYLDVRSDTPDETPVDEYWIGEVRKAIAAGEDEAAQEILYKFVNRDWFQHTYHSGLRVITHKGDKIGHIGYWCYEGAAVAKILDIDDTRLRGHKYYPWDLAHPE